MTISRHLKSLNTFNLCMISVASIINLRNSPFMASLGWQSVFFYLLAAICYLIPSALVCAELASTWPEGGGVYLWVKKGLGQRYGFLAIWLEWINNVVAFPATLAFMATTIAYVFIPEWAQHRFYLLTTMLFILWGTTLFNFLGVKASSQLNMIGALLGTLIPGSIIVILAFIWLWQGHPSTLPDHWQAMFPPLQINHLVFFTGVLGAYAGMQITAFHAQNVKNPKRDYPLAIFSAVVIIITTTILVALAIATVVPQQKMSLISGMLDGFQIFFQSFHLPWAVHVLALLMIIGSFSSLSSWLLGPARGLQVAVSEGFLPDFFAKLNRQEMPVTILILQAIIASLFASLFVFMPNYNTSFWILIALTSQSTVLMYMLVFASAFLLRIKEKNISRPFKIPGGIIGVLFICGLGFITCALAYVIGFFPPSSMKVGNIYRYEFIFIASTLLFISFPLALHFRQKKLSK